MRRRRLTLGLALALGISVALVAGGGAATSAVRNSSGGPYRNGLIAFVRCCGPASLYVIRPDGTGERRIFKASADDTPMSPAWSPDGKWIAFIPGPPRKGVWMMRADGSKLHRITIGKGIPQELTWSPNGKRIAFADRQSPGSGFHDIYVVRTNGSGLRRLASSRLEESAPAWAPNGAEIVFNRGRNLWRMKPDGSGQRLLARGIGGVSWSPGGSRFAFGRGGDLWTMKRDGTDAKRVVEMEGDQPGAVWSPDSRWLITGSFDRGDLMLVRIDGSQIHALTNASGYFNSGPAWQRLPR